MDQAAIVREKIDLVSLISEYIPLKKTGQNFKTNCPFHNEKSPSFVVSPERQIWHCFGCQKGGDAFTFLMEYEHMEFPEALRTLAQKVGVELEQYKFDTGIASQKEKLYRINSVACEYYHYVLTKHPVGKIALEYLTEKRKISPATINTYRLGFSPIDGTALTQYLLKKKNFSKLDVVETGLVNDYGNRVKDFFQGRIMFPLFDHRGNNIGFSGRVLNDIEKTAKYINTRETLIYHKGSVFFGLNTSKEAIKKENRAIIMEGEFDVISCFQEGITNTVAVKGTALTQDQVNLLARFAQKISLCFDGDKAGQEAIKRSLSILEKKGLTTTVIVTPDGKDADESIKHNPTAFKIAVKNDIDIYEYLFDQTLKQYDADTAEGKRYIGDSLLPLFNNIQNEIIKEHHLRKLSRALDISQDTLVREMTRLGKREIIKKDVVIPKVQKSGEEIREDYLLSLIVQYPNPDLLACNVEEILSSYEFHTQAYKKILDRIIAYGKTHEIFNTKEFLRALPQELLALFDVCYITPLPNFPDDVQYQLEVKKTAKDLHTTYLHAKIKKLGSEIDKKEKEGTETEIADLQQQLQELVELLHKA
ncbi:MAG TPA: DNA primase [Candidatus Saccharimonadales bacterium]|nr:DNA primase [Candidatus Saccharimonadales bacterium]